MRNFLLFPVLFLLINELHGQSTYDFRQYFVSTRLTSTPVGTTAPQGVNKITFINKKQKRTYKAYKLYNKMGKATHLYKFDKSGVEQLLAKMDYDNRGNLITEEHFKKGKRQRTFIYARTENNSPLEQKRLNKKNKVVSRYQWVYNKQGCVSSLITYKRGGIKVNKKWEYEYYDSCKLLQTRLYNRRGKLKQTWDFACNTEGEKLEKKKNTDQVCRWEQKSDTAIARVWQRFDEKGRTQRDIMFYTIKDTLPLEWHVYNFKNKMSVKIIYNKSLDRISRRIHYDKKGGIEMEWRIIYQDSLKISDMCMRKGKITYRQDYTFDNNKLPIEIRYTGSKKKHAAVMTVVYQSE